MNLTQWVSIVVVVALSVLPTVVAALINGWEKSKSEAEFEYDYR